MYFNYKNTQLPVLLLIPKKQLIKNFHNVKDTACLPKCLTVIRERNTMVIIYII